jgi:DNA-binding transcriptional MerR regulator
MNTPQIDPLLQKTVREYFSDYDWKELARDLGVSLKEIQHMLNFNSPRNLTFHFVGLLAALKPHAWDTIAQEYRK